jgi:type IV pilus assembly protein PilA
MLQVKDPNHLQQTLRTLLVLAPVTVDQSDDDGFTSYILHSPSLKASMEITYAFVDGYLIVASSHKTLTEAVRMHRNGESLAKSKRLLASLPPGHPSGLSALLFEDPSVLARMSLSHNAPELAQYLAPAGAGPPIVAAAYGEESAIGGASTSAGFRAGAILAIGAIAIPNFLRARIAANEASAVGSIRSVVVAEAVYANTYSGKGYARDLATLGPDPHGTSTKSAEHAGFIDATLGDARCTASEWCTKSGFRFILVPACYQKICNDFVVIGTPVSSDAGERSFCSTSAGRLHSKTGPPLTEPITVKECQAWPPLQ